MLSSKDRLRSREVREVFEKGKRRTAPTFSIIFLPSTDRTAFAVTVSKKTAKNAVDRNKIRRRIYSILSKIKNFKTKVHAVFVPRKEILKTPFDVLEKEIKESLVRATIIQ